MAALDNLKNESAVELRILIPLFERLGYGLEDISPKHAVVFQKGRTGRKHEADFVLFSGPLHDENNSLIVVEAKSLDENLEEAERQAASYALAIRAPLLWTCNGTTVEIWQLNLARASDKIASFGVDDLETNFPFLFSVLSKPAAIEICRNVTGKRIAEFTSDFGPYENAELSRTIQPIAPIRRRLIQDGSESEIDSETVPTAYSDGAIIVAPSGIGKTSLSISIHRALIAERCGSGGGRLSVHIPMQDVPLGESVLRFAANRLGMFNRTVSETSLPALIRDTGLVLVLDEYDRLTPGEQSARESELRLVLRDHPNVALFVFSRRSAHPALPLALLELTHLDREERYSLIESRLPDAGRQLIHSMPPVLDELCRNPLILNLTIDFWLQSNRLPARIEDVFRKWLERTVQLDHRRPAAATRREAALELIALETMGRRLSATEADSALVAAGHSKSILDELTSCDALTLDGGAIGFHHEALADYLRANKIARSPPSFLREAIETTEFRPDSLLPVLLMALLRSPAHQSTLWRRLADINFDLYLEMLRYRADITPDLWSIGALELSRTIVEDVLSGIRIPTEAFFPTLKKYIYRELTGEPADDISMLGHANEHSITYTVIPALNEEPTVAVASPTADQGFSSINFRPSGMRLDSGRLIGGQRLRETLRSLIDRRTLLGREHWRRGKVASHLRYLRKKADASLRVEDPISSWIDFLRPNEGRSLYDGLPLRRLFEVDGLLEDLRALAEAGIEHLDDDMGMAQFRRGKPDEKALTEALRGHFREMQLVYREIVEESFPSLMDHMRFYTILPINWNVNVILDSGNDMYSTIQYFWEPVEHWNDASASVSFSNIRTSFDRSYFSRVESKLTALGRRSKRNRVSAGSRALWSFRNGHGRMAEYEGSGFQDACQMVQDDVAALFADMPYSDSDG